MTYSHMGTPTLPSAQLRFTSEFGMGSGGATALWSPDKFVSIWNVDIKRVSQVFFVMRDFIRTYNSSKTAWVLYG